MTIETRAIRIVSPPDGEAPPWVREAWVGAELPLAGEAGQIDALTYGVTSGPRTIAGRIWGLIAGKPKRRRGYPVDAITAVGILAATHPDAAVWWRDNVPHALRGGRVFLFNEASCSPVPLPDPNDR